MAFPVHEIDVKQLSLRFKIRSEVNTNEFRKIKHLALVLLSN